MSYSICLFCKFQPIEDDSPTGDINAVKLELTDGNSNKTLSNRDSSPDRDEVPSVPAHHAVIKTDDKQREPMPPPSRTEPSDDGGTVTNDSSDNKTTNSTAKMTSSASDQSAVSSNVIASESSSANEKSDPPAIPVMLTASDKNGPQSSLSAAHSEESLSLPQGGTLADLKKYRAQRLQENLRNKDNISVHSLGDEHSSHNHSDSENSLLTTPSNGQNKTTHNGIQYKNTYYIAEERPKHKFTATNSEIIGDDSKTGCCVIL